MQSPVLNCPRTVRKGVCDLESLAVGLLYDTAFDAVGDVFSLSSLDVMLRLLYVDRLLVAPVILPYRCAAADDDGVNRPKIATSLYYLCR